MGSKVTKVESERAFDALIDALPIVGRIAQAPRTEADLLSQLPRLTQPDLQKHLAALIRNDLIRETDGVYFPATHTFETLWQDRMVGLASQLVMPSLFSLYDGASSGHLIHLELKIDKQTVESLFKGPVTRFFDRLVASADASTTESSELRFAVFGTTRTPTVEPGIDRMIEVLRRSAQDRTSSKMRPYAMLSTAIGTFDSNEDGTKPFLDLVDELKKDSVPYEQATFSVVLSLEQRTQE